MTDRRYLDRCYKELLHYGHGLTAEMISECADGAENWEQLFVRLSERCEYERREEEGE